MTIALPPSSTQQLPAPVNQTAGIVNKVIVGAETGLVDLAESMAIAADPWLGLPGIKQIWEALFQYFANLFTRASQTGATFLIIDSQVSSEQRTLSTALIALQAAELSGDATRIQKAIQNYANANSAEIRDDGSAPTTV
jgi:hypothetical protein